MASLLPQRSQDYAGWYNALIQQAGLAEYADVRGCMIIKPYGFALWEQIQAILDRSLKAAGHVNAYFPLFVPLGHFSKEAAHVQGFAKECAVVTHYRLRDVPGQGIALDPTAQLEEPLVVRPTSETTVWRAYSKWIQSYRDLPLRINQWANVVRWEMRTRPFLRTTEILWQEGHTAHATAAEAMQQTRATLDLYTDFIQDYLAMPVYKGKKTPQEQFAGADTTYTLELLMPDGKALQAGTSHFLGQHFARAFDVKFTDAAGQLVHPWGTSWGLTTRLIGALAMVHGDDRGLVLPPKLAPIQTVLVPIPGKGASMNALAEQATGIQAALEAKGITVKLDQDPVHTPGWKFTEYELKGVPIRLSIGSRELAGGTVELYRRDTQAKTVVPLAQLEEQVPILLQAIQDNLYRRAQQFRDTHTLCIDDYDTFQAALRAHKGFVLAYWDGTAATERVIKTATQATIRCIPLDDSGPAGRCIYSGKPAEQRVLFAQAY